MRADGKRETAPAGAPGSTELRAGRGLDADEQAPDRTSPLRWLLLIVPLVVIVAMGTWLVTTWSARVSRFAEDLSVRQRAPLPQPRPVAPSPPPGAPTSRPVAPQPAVAPRPPPPAELDVRSVVAAIAKADPEAGEATFKICRVCHNADPSGATKFGPNLWGVVGRRKAARAAFAYSESLRARGGVWTYEELATFIHNPRKAMPGTKMAFAGIGNPRRLADLLAHLRTLGDTPAPLPPRP